MYILTTLISKAESLPETVQYILNSLSSYCNCLYNDYLSKSENKNGIDKMHLIIMCIFLGF